MDSNVKTKIMQATSCTDFFQADKQKIQTEYKRLAKLLHPDVCKDSDASIVMSRLNFLYEEALEKIEKGIWEVKGLMRFELANGRQIEYKYKDSKVCEFGMTYVGISTVAYVFTAGLEDFHRNAIAVLKSITYANPSMEKEFAQKIPQDTKKAFSYKSSSIEDMRLADGNTLLLVEKKPNMYPLENVLNAQGGSLDARHVAWVVNRLLSICCLLEYNGLAHNGICLSNLFLNPQDHEIALMGGWWYAVPLGKPMIGTHSSIYAMMSPAEKTKKVGNIAIDIESVKLVARQLLNNGASTPKPILDWLDQASKESAFDEVSAWSGVLTTAYGPRTFVELNLDMDKVYPQN